MASSHRPDPPSGSMIQAEADRLAFQPESHELEDDDDVDSLAAQDGYVAQDGPATDQDRHSKAKYKADTSSATTPVPGTAVQSRLPAHASKTQKGLAQPSRNNAIKNTTSSNVADSAADPAAPKAGAVASKSQAPSAKTQKGLARPRISAGSAAVPAKHEPETDLEAGQSSSGDSDVVEENSRRADESHYVEEPLTPESEVVATEETPSLITREEASTNSYEQHQQQDLHLVEASLVTVPSITDENNINNNDVDLQLQLAEVVDPDQQSWLSRCIPRSSSAKLFCFGMALLLTLVAVTGIVCGSGLCSGSASSDGSQEESVIAQDSSSSGSALVPKSPTAIPSATPTVAPSFAPTAGPSSNPTPIPTLAPTPLLLDLPNFTLAALDDPTSPQSLAYSWFVNYMSVNQQRTGNSTLEPWRQDQLFALACIYYSLNGDNWAEVDRQQWLDESVSECDWAPAPKDGEFQLTCNAAGQLIAFLPDSFDYRLVGTIPPEISMLSSLQELDVDQCQLGGKLEDVLPSQITALSNTLTQLSFYWNNLEGTIPEYIGNLTRLRGLYLASNYLSGEIPSSFASLTDLTFLQVNDHTPGISGGLSADLLMSWSNLELLWADDNILTGSLPTELGRMTSMSALWLHDNNWRGTIPSSLANMRRLRDFYLYYTNLSGTFPLEICALPLINEIGLDCSDVPCPANCSCTCEFGD